MDVGRPRAWAGAARGARPNDLIADSIDRRACSRRVRLAKARVQAPGQCETVRLTNGRAAPQWRHHVSAVGVVLARI